MAAEGRGPKMQCKGPRQFDLDPKDLAGWSQNKNRVMTEQVVATDSCCILLYDIHDTHITVYHNIYHNNSQYITSNALPMLLGRVLISFSALACTLSTWVSLNRMRPWGLKPLSKSSSHSWPKSLGQLGQLYEWCRNKRKHTGSYRLSNPTMKFVCWS